MACPCSKNHSFFGGRWPIPELQLTSMDYRKGSLLVTEDILKICPVAQAHRFHSTGSYRRHQAIFGQDLVPVTVGQIFLAVIFVDAGQIVCNPCPVVSSKLW
jgi:hypothetical protein